MILASTFASAAAGSHDRLGPNHPSTGEGTGRQGGSDDLVRRHESAGLRSGARNAILSDAAASDDSDIRNTAHEGTTLAAAGLAIAERTGAAGQDLLGAMILGYEAAGRIGEARSGGRGGCTRRRSWRSAALPPRRSS